MSGYEKMYERIKEEELAFLLFFDAEFNKRKKKREGKKCLSRVGQGNAFTLLKHKKVI